MADLSPGQVKCDFKLEHELKTKIICEKLRKISAKLLLYILFKDPWTIIDGNAVTRSILLGFKLSKNKISLKLKNNISLFSDIFGYELNWASYGVSVVFVRFVYGLYAKHWLEGGGYSFP